MAAYGLFLAIHPRQGKEEPFLYRNGKAGRQPQTVVILNGHLDKPGRCRNVSDVNAHGNPLSLDSQDALAAQRVAARGELAVAFEEGRTRLKRLHQQGAAVIRFPRRTDALLEAVLINTAGGLTGGDRLAWQAEAGSGASLTLTTQACEKVYRSQVGRAEVSVRLRVGEGSRVNWLPQETIVFDRSAFSRRLDVDLAEGASVLLAEATIFGRTAMGEAVQHCLFHDRWRVRSGERLVHAEDFAIGPDTSRALSRVAVAGSGIAVATILLIAPDADVHLEAVREVTGPDGGASFWRVGSTGKLLARLVAGDGYALHKGLAPLVELLNGRAALPKVWST